MSLRQPHSFKAKAKWLSKCFMVFSLLFSAGLTLHTEESDAANRTVKKANTKKPVVRKKKNPTTKRALQRRNQNTPAGVFALYQNPLFGYGKCLPGLVEPAKKILARNGIDTLRANENEKIALAKGVAQVERLLGKPIPNLYQYDYQWIEASGPWNSGLSRPGFVTVKRPRGSLKGQLTGRMMHELGHRFGHANANENYIEYRKHMRGKKCMITTYCGKNLNEEFAEVFAAYVVNPDFLAKHCPDSYAYFKNKLFRNPEALNVSCENPNSILDHEHDNNDDDAVEESGEQQIDVNEDFELPETGPMVMMNPRMSEAAPTTTETEPVSTPEVAPQAQENQVAEPTAEAAPVEQQAAPVSEVKQEEPVATPAAPVATAPATTDEMKTEQYALPTGLKIPVPAARPQR